MLRYKTETRPGLVALYDIRPGNGAGPSLQPRSPHGAHSSWSAALLMPVNSLYIFSSLYKPQLVSTLAWKFFRQLLCSVFDKEIQIFNQNTVFFIEWHSNHNALTNCKQGKISNNDV